MIVNTVHLTEKSQSCRDDFCEELLNKTVCLTNTVCSVFLNDDVNQNKYVDDIIINSTCQITLNKPWHDLFVISMFSP